VFAASERGGFPLKNPPPPQLRRVLTPDDELSQKEAVKSAKITCYFFCRGFSVSLKFVMPASIRGPQFGNRSAPALFTIAFLYATNNTKGSLLEKLIVAKLAKFHAFYDTQEFIAVVSTACCFSVLWNM
jgi:hypothetical protein